MGGGGKARQAGKCPNPWKTSGLRDNTSVSAGPGAGIAFVVKVKVQSLRGGERQVWTFCFVVYPPPLLLSDKRSPPRARQRQERVSQQRRRGNKAKTSPTKYLLVRILITRSATNSFSATANRSPSPYRLYDRRCQSPEASSFREALPEQSLARDLAAKDR